MNEEPQICYLAEASEINQNGNLRGKSLRCYEVTLVEKINSPYSTRLIPTPTGVMYTLKNNKLIKSKTSASLNNKYVSNTQIRTTIDNHSSWASAVYASPELAIAAKLQAIHRDRTDLKMLANQLLAKLEDYQHYTDSLHEMANEHPEFFI